MRRRFTGFLMFVVLCAGIALVPIACSDDGDDTDASTPTDTATSMTPG
jgi:hypothetical protein